METLRPSSSISCAKIRLDFPIGRGSRSDPFAPPQTMRLYRYVAPPHWRNWSWTPLPLILPVHSR
ncbi:hypothetical protein BJX96DRAFT_145948 [Aspergillus floccosus]